MSALLITLLAAAVAAVAGWLAHRYHRDRADQADAIELEQWLQVMRGVDEWPATDRAFDDHADQALTVVADELTVARLDRAVHQRHPAGGAR